MKKSCLIHSHFKFSIFVLISLVGISSCRKEFIDTEPTDPVQLEKIKTFLNGPKMTRVNYLNVEGKLAAINLGTLSSALQTVGGKGKLMTINAPEVYSGFSINKDSVIVITANGHTSYVFQVPLSSPYARSFQNLTIDESKDGVLVFVNSYTPTKQWLADWKAGHAGKFDGSIEVTRLNISGNTALSSFQTTDNSDNSVRSGQKLSVIHGATPSALAQICETTTYYYSVPYNCGSGNHGPGDSACNLTGDGAAGYVNMSSTITACTTINDGGGGGGNSGGGGGGTTPNVPPGYNPCPTAPTPVSYQAAKGQKFLIHENTTPCDPVILPPVSPAGSTTINNFVLDLATQIKYPKFTDMLKKLEGFVASDKKVMDALKLYSGFSEAEILTKVKFGQGPQVIIKEMTGQFGYFNRTENPNVINISASWARGLEAANLVQTRQATGFLLAVTVLHEFVHQARAANGLDRNYEYGFGFENAAFGMRIEDDGAYKYSYKLYEK